MSRGSNGRWWWVRYALLAVLWMVGVVRVATADVLHGAWPRVGYVVIISLIVVVALVVVMWCDRSPREDAGRRQTMKVRPIFAWYDLWVGVFIDSAKRRVYVFPLPCVGLVVTW